MDYSRCALTTQRLDGQFRQRDDKQAAIMVAAAPRSRGGAPKKWLVRLDDATANGQCRQRDNLQAAVMIFAAKEAGAVHIGDG